MKVLVVADCHGKFKLMNEMSDFSDIDAVFLLGDNSYTDLRTVLNLIPDETPVFGVLGNHDSVELYDEINEDFPSRITDVNGRVVYLNDFDITIGGLSGSLRYKPDPFYCMVTQEEAGNILKDMPYCDILLTHDRLYEYTEGEDEAHVGLHAIGDYLKRQKPRYQLHGHLHAESYRTYCNTEVMCCYGVSVVEL